MDAFSERVETRGEKLVPGRCHRLTATPNGSPPDGNKSPDELRKGHRGGLMAFLRSAVPGVLMVLALGACASPPQVPEISPRDVIWKIRPPSEIREVGKQRNPEWRAVGLTWFTLEPCVIMTPPPSPADLTGWALLVAHELRHCQEGQFHAPGEGTVGVRQRPAH